MAGNVTIADLLKSKGELGSEVNDSYINLQCNNCFSQLTADRCLISSEFVTEYACPYCKHPLITIIDLSTVPSLHALGLRFEGFTLQSIVQMQIGRNLYQKCPPLATRINKLWVRAPAADPGSPRPKS